MSRPPWSATVTGLIAPVGVTMPALIVAPALARGASEDPPDGDELDPLLPQAARIDAEQRYGNPDHGAAADEVAAGQPSGGELVDDVVSDLALALAQLPEAFVIDLPGHAEPPWDGAGSFSCSCRSSVIGMWQRIR